MKKYSYTILAKRNLREIKNSLSSALGRKEGKARKKREKKKNIPSCLSVHLTCTSFCKTSGFGGLNSAGLASVTVSWSRDQSVLLVLQPVAPSLGWYSNRETQKEIIDRVFPSRAIHHKEAVFVVLSSVWKPNTKFQRPYKFQLTPSDPKVTPKPLHARVGTWIPLNRLLMLLTVSSNYRKTLPFSTITLKVHFTVD